MTESTAVQAENSMLNAQQDISDLELDQVSGGLNPQPLPPRRLAKIPTLSIGSQSSGAGAGKVTFNPF